MTLPAKRVVKLTLGTAAVVLAFLALVYAYFPIQNRLLIAPMIGGLEACTFWKQDTLRKFPDHQFTKLCAKEASSASELIEATLNTISDRRGKVGNYELGYTLNVPLFMLFHVNGSSIQLNQEAVQRVAQAVNHVDRPVILYLFQNHFGVNSPAEKVLAQNPDNLLHTRLGPLSTDRYYTVNIYPWTFTNTDNDITRFREQAFNALLDEICKLPARAIKRVEGVTMLGELHHLFPNFEAGMGYSGDYLISDYSKHSVLGFRRFLIDRYKDIADLNFYLGSHYSSFDEVAPPSKDIRKDPLKQYSEHIDSFAHGTLPISGWVGKKSSLGGQTAAQDWIQIFDNGEFLARVPVAYGRQDVLAARPELGTADVGWEYNFDFSRRQRGLHQISIFLERVDTPLIHLTTRQIAVMDRSQAAPQKLPVRELPKSVPVDSSVLSYTDHPGDLTSYYYNPLVELWHEFRKSQVANYLDHFGTLAKSKCIKPELIYSHQILPFVNPGWDENKYAVGRDLAVPANLQLGISLYGEASYGTSFFDWYGGIRRNAYGVTEFHPLKAMDAPTLNSVFEKHYLNGAKFLSFFAEGYGLTEDPTNQPNPFSFARNNKNAGSDVLFESTRAVLK
jgi:hypothetical protein